MMKNKNLIFTLAFIAFGLFLINFSSAAGGYCCEKTLSGAFCQNAPQAQCDPKSSKIKTI